MDRHVLSVCINTGLVLDSVRAIKLPLTQISRLYSIVSMNSDSELKSAAARHVDIQLQSGWISFVTAVSNPYLKMSLTCRC